ncbi:uncharacterized protein CDAR_201131 [Caerostris darwini]|uniref:Uncharacterized protein n=1 Tax=Caerostris darwini TaxID=1538125 RepID=A0AAV4P6D2_9ARAC|nr:uncharacterized protein CDAR_201131 [Caerostris darwini]
MNILQSVPVVLILFHLVSGTNYGGGGYGHGWHDKIPSKIIVKHIPKHVPIYKPYPIPKPVPVPKPVGFLKPLAIAKPFNVPHVVPVIKHFQKPFPVLKKVPIHFPIPLPKLVKLPFQIKLPKPYIVRVPKPYAVAKKFPVAVPVHIPRPYVVPVYKSVPVGVPQKIPKIIPVIKEVPEYVKKPVPVYIEEKPYKPDNYKGTPYIPSGGSYKGSPFPEGIGGGHKGSPFPEGIGSGHKGTPFPGGIGGGYKGIPFPSGFEGSNKGTPYGKGGNNGGGGYHAKGTNPHATSAASFLAAHAGKLQSQHSNYQDILGAYSQNQAYSGLQSLGGGIHGGYQGFGNFHNFGGNGFEGSHIEDIKQHSNYDQGLGGFDNLGVYARGVGNEKQNVPEPEKYQQEDQGYNSEGHESNAGAIPYDNNNHDGGSENGGNNEGQGGYNNPAYLGVSFTTFNDQGGRGGGYHSDSSANKEYNNQEGYENQEEGNQNHEENQGYDDGKYQEQYNNGGRGENGFGNIPALTLYQLHNGAATAISNNAGVNYYNTGYQQQDHGNQGVNSQGYGYNGNAGYENQNYQQNDGAEEDKGPYQQNSYGYQVNHPAATQQNNQQYSPLQNQENSNSYGNQEPSHQNEGAYKQIAAYQNQGAYNHQGHSEVYHNQASYQVNHAPEYGNEGEYGQQNVAAGLQNYGLKAAYPVQTGEESSNHLQSSSGAVYVRAYDNQDGNQAPYKVQQQGEDNYQAEDTHQKETYSPYVSPKDSGSDSQKETSDKLSLAATGRSSDTLVGSSNGYSTPEGGETKGGSWRGVQ